MGDHLYVSGSEKRCAQQLVEVAKAEHCAVSAVQPTHESKLPYYGTVGGQRVAEPQGALRDRPGHREADAHRGRAEAPRAGPARRPLPVLLRHARPDAAPHGAAGRGAPRGGRPEGRAPHPLAREARLARALPRHRAAGDAATTSASSTASSRPSWRWRSPAATATRCSPCWSSSWRRGRDADRAHHRRRPSPAQPVARRGLRAGWASRELLAECAELDAFRRRSDNLYERVRALFFLLRHPPLPPPGRPSAARPRCPTPAAARPLPRLRAPAGTAASRRPSTRSWPSRHARRAERRASPARWPRRTSGSPSRRWPTRSAAASARCAATSGCSASATRPTTRCASSPELLEPSTPTAPFPILRERTPVRMDLTHSGWSDIFFLGMDYPEGAQGAERLDRPGRPRPRRRAAPAGRGLPARDRRAGPAADQRRPGRHARTSTTSPRCSISRKDYLGLLKAGGDRLGHRAARRSRARGRAWRDLLARVVGPGRGLEIVSNVNDIPKGSRLAVSTNLLASLISVCMRATGQAASLDRARCEETSAGWSLARAHPRRMAGRLRRRLAGLRRRLARHQADRRRARPARAIPSSASAAAGSCRTTASSDQDDASPETRAQTAGQPGPRPRRHGAERRPDPGDGHREVPAALRGRVAGAAGACWASSTRSSPRCAAATCARIGAADHPQLPRAPPDDHPLGHATTYTETLIARVRERVRRRLLGLLDARRHVRRRHGLHLRARSARREAQDAPAGDHVARPSASSQHALPFAMEPVVYDFAINERGTCADLLDGGDGADAARLLHAHGPGAAAPGPPRAARRCAAPSSTTSAPPAATRPELRGMVQTLFDAMLPRGQGRVGRRADARPRCSREHGFDRVQHEQIRADLQRRAASAWPRTACPPSAVIEDVPDERRGRRRASASRDDGLRARRVERSAARRGRRRDAGRRRRQPLDAGRRRGQGAASVLQARRPAPHLPRDPPGQEPPRRARGSAPPSRTSSRPAT